MSIRARAGSRLLAAVLAVVVAGLTACGSSVSDPESARCNAPHVTFGPKVVLAGHSEIGVHFRCAGAVLAGTPAVTTGEEQQWSQLAGEDAASPPALTPEKKAEITRQLQPSGFDPVPLLKQMTVPGIWVYGRQDRSQPAEKSAATLERLRT